MIALSSRPAALSARSASSVIVSSSQCTSADAPQDDERTKRVEQVGRVDAGHSVGRAGEDLEERDSCRVQGRDPVDPVRPDVRREPVVDVGAVGQVCALVGQIGDLADRVAVGVLDDRGHARARGRLGAGREVLALGRTRVHQVHVGVDHARQQVQTGRVDDLAGVGIVRGDRGDAPVVDVDVQTRTAARPHDRGTLEREIVGHGSLRRSMPGS
jgi:hypothetical protein